MKKENIFNRILNISFPWEVDALSFSKHERNIEILFNFTATTLNCPVCGRAAKVIGKKCLEWNYLNLLDCQTQMRVYLPIVESHNIDCRANYNQSVIRNTFALDLIFKLLDGSEVIKPLHVLLNSQETICDLR